MRRGLARTKREPGASDLLQRRIPRSKHDPALHSHVPPSLQELKTNPYA